MKLPLRYHYAYKAKPASNLHNILLSISLFLTACSEGTDSADGSANMPPQAHAPAAEFDAVYSQVSCTELTGNQIGTNNTSDVDCGLVSVPADWNDVAGPTIELAVYRIPGRSAAADTAPLVYLEGGPGKAGAPKVLDFANGDADWLRERSDIYIIDQRGTGYSRPALYCREVSAAIAENRPAAEGHRECRDRLVQSGVNPANFTTRQSALDVNAVRSALGIASWNMYSVGYAASLALTIMRDQAEGIRSVVLDSAVPPQVNIISETPFAAYRALEQIDTNCLADTDCAGNIGGLLQGIESGIARLSVQPLGSLNAQQYVELLGARMANPRLAELIQLVSAGGEIDIGTLIQEISGDSGNINQSAHTAPQVLQPFISLATGMSYSVICAEEYPYRNTQASPAITTNFLASTRVVVDHLPAEFHAELCEIWNVPPASSLDSIALTSAIPTLLLSSDANYRAPPDWSMLAADSLPMSQLVILHGPSPGLLGSSSCVNRITRQFLDNPAGDVDTDCILDMPRVDYIAGDFSSR
jgi:pimeloyl-ACP methyl ester carboxylesterase